VLPKRLQFPLIVKSLTYEASIGISQASVVENEEQLARGCSSSTTAIGTAAIVEQFIDGRELYVGVIGQRAAAVFPVWEMSFAKMPENNWRIATERVKWSVKYQKRHGIMTERRALEPDVASGSSTWPSAPTARSTSAATPASTGDAQTVFLERKLRTGTRLAKRRTIVDLDTLSYLEDSDAARGVEATSDAIAADPTLWFRRRIALRRLRPECQVQYARTARVGEATSGPLRLTLDEHVTTVPVNSFDFAAGTGAPILVGQMVLELKYSNRVPALFKELIEEFRLTPTAASKYRFAVEALGTVPLHA
jgi:hypothetical protein